jgi:phytoene dehydrogenase-like protein
VPSRPYDVIVIGAGLAGLLSAAILARRGRRVLILEREPVAGGRLRSYDLDGYVIDAGAYLWPNLHLDRALAAAGADGFAGSTIPPTEVMRVFVQGDGGRRRSFPWPGRSLSPALVDAAAVTLRADARTAHALADLWVRLAQLSDAEVTALRHVALRDALPRFAPEPALAAAFRRNVMLFGTYDPDAASMAECVALGRRRADAAAPRPECAGPNAVGGVRALPRAVHAAAAAHGVELRLGWEVEHIAVARGRIAGVFAHERSRPFAERLVAPVVVCNAPVWCLPALLGSRVLAPELASAARDGTAVGGVIAAAFAFEGLPRLRETGAPDAFRGWTRLLTGPEAAFGGGCLWATLHSPHNAPAGQHVLQAMRLSPHADLADAERVASVHAAFRAMLDEMYRDAAARLRREWYWITRDGSEYMIHAGRRPPVRVPEPAGLYLVGESTDVAAIQIDAAALSALECAAALS